MNNTVFKRKFRWLLSGNLPGGQLEPIFVKVAARPQMPGEPPLFPLTYETIQVTIWEAPESLWKTLEGSYQEGIEYAPQEKLGSFNLKLLDGCGVQMEEWILQDAYVSHLGDVFIDYSSSNSDFELTIRYKKCEYKPYDPSAPSPQVRSMGLGTLGSLSRKVKCPKCSHEFPDCSIVF